MALTREKIGKFRRVLERLDGRVQGDAQSLENQARIGLGGEAGGNLSNAPMHLADLGTEQYFQELNATLLENEAYIRREVQDAIGRIDRDAYGICERCGTSIIEERLEALPYTRYCTKCSAEVGDGAVVDLNAGRPEAGMGGLERRQGAGEHAHGGLEDPDQPFTDEASRGGAYADVHAAGTAGGGTAVGGLAGTNIGEGDPDDGDLEDAMGSGNYDQELDEDDEDTTAYSGPEGGAVGGAVADRRATGGKTGGGIAPQPGPGDSPVGQ
ncbi:General stress protein 16O [Aquisphaera giovannonii]|uniref:General stress protein 16O n=1 Tax=Aquisphaera giovannonii TaxID=406548 RepID=A0A5B9WDW1_9BACT|nr:TraR/DksA C4-type zinc finger protein [Aquisphaera giovannonii]QEH38772.1 General stress protein 16O [Aquisphaera giovannonii]